MFNQKEENESNSKIILPVKELSKSLIVSKKPHL